MKVVRNVLMYGLMCGSASAMAGAMGSVCEGQDLTLPCVASSWGLEVHALYLQASEEGMRPLQNIQTSNGRLPYGVNTKWGWGFQVGGSLEWDSGSDFVWNWYNYRNAKNRFDLGAPVNLGTIVIHSQYPGAFSKTKTQVKIDSLNFSKSIQWDQVNFEFGQTINVTSAIHLRPHADLQVTRIANYLVANFLGSSLEEGISQYGENWTSSFSGAGPRLGAEFTYADENGWGFYAQGAAGILAGAGKSNLSHVDKVAQWTNIYSTSSLPVVASFDAKLGSRLKFDVAQGILDVEVAWMWNAYSHAISVYEPLQISYKSDFSIQGVFFGLKWLGTIA